MIKQKEITDIAYLKRLPKSTIDKDWVLGHFLDAFYSFKENKNLFVFKGGTCLHKCYIENYRFSEDLDFTLLDENFVVDKSFTQKIIRKAKNKSLIEFYISTIDKRYSNDIPQGYEIKIKFWGADHNPNRRPLPPLRWLNNINLDISFSEQLFLPIVEKEIRHPYSDIDTITNKATCYDLVELLSEKIRSLKQRNRPRDVYDVWYLSKIFSDDSLNNVKEILLKKIESKKLAIGGTCDFVNSDKYIINKAHWKASLENQLDFSLLPGFDDIYNELSQFINKLL